MIFHRVYALKPCNDVAQGICLRYDEPAEAVVTLDDKTGKCHGYVVRTSGGVSRMLLSMASLTRTSQ